MTRLERAKPQTPRRLVVPSLTIANLASRTSIMVINILLVEIASSFGVSVGVAGQIRTAASAISVITALLVASLSVRYGHKLILTTGLLLISISALGCSFAPDLATMLLAYSVSGFGVAMVQPMCNAIVGEYFPIERRGSAMSWNMVGYALASVIGAPIVGLLGDWRLAFLVYAFPLALLSLFLALRVLPSSSSKAGASGGKVSFLGGLGEVLRNRSALACLVGCTLASAAIQIGVYGTAFYKQRFSVSTSLASAIVIVLMLFYISGSLVSGQLVNRLGRKRLTVLAALFSGLFGMPCMLVTDLWLSQALYYMAGMFVGIMGTARVSLALEQVPAFRGTMMSLSQVAMSMGETLGIALGGAVLLSYGYGAVSLSVVGMAPVAALVFFFLVVDPTRPPKSGSR